jgi:hypothetical protein
MSRLDDLHAQRAAIDADIAVEVALLEAEAQHQRDRLRAIVMSQGRRLTVVAKCGTDAGYYRHIRTLREPACEGCLLAHRRYERQRSARKRLRESA